MIDTRVDWEELYNEAKAAVERAYLVIDDLTGWSSSSGDWVLQDAFTRIKNAREAFKEKTR